MSLFKNSALTHKVRPQTLKWVDKIYFPGYNVSNITQEHIGKYFYFKDDGRRQSLQLAAILSY